MTSPVTLAPATTGLPVVIVSPLARKMTSLKVTLSPEAASSFSTAIVSPGLTRYCLPPERMIAYAMLKIPVLERRKNCHSEWVMTTDFFHHFPAGQYSTEFLDFREGWPPCRPSDEKRKSAKKPSVT